MGFYFEVGENYTSSKHSGHKEKIAKMLGEEYEGLGVLSAKWC